MKKNVVAVDDGRHVCSANKPPLKPPLLPREGRATTHATSTRARRVRDVLLRRSVLSWRVCAVWLKLFFFFAVFLFVAERFFFFFPLSTSALRIVCVITISAPAVVFPITDIFVQATITSAARTERERRRTTQQHNKREKKKGKATNRHVGSVRGRSGGDGVVGLR